MCGGPLSLFLVLSLLPLLLQGIHLQDYELVVGHGNGLVFWSQNHTHNVVVTELGVKTRIVSILPHLQTNSIYFTTLTKDTASVTRYLPANNSSHILFKGPKGSVGSLTFFNGGGSQDKEETLLLWANPSNKSVWSLPLNATTTEEPKLFFQDPNATFDSIAFHPATRRLLYTVWRRANLSEILSYDPSTSTISTLVDNVFQPRGLYVAGDDDLYWIDNPPGIYFNLEKVTLSPSGGERGGPQQNNFNRVLLLKGQNQHPYSLAVPCPSSSIVWTELMHKALMSWSPLTKTYNTLDSSFSNNNNPPHGLALLNPICPPPTTITTTTPTILSLPFSTANSSPPHELNKKDEMNTAKTTTSSTNGPTTSLSDKKKLVGKVVACESPWEEEQCINGATCLKLDSVLHCLCKPGFSGPRCRDQNKEQFGQHEGLRAKNRESESRESWSSNNVTEEDKTEQLRLAVIILGCMVGLLGLVIVGLVIKLKKLNKKPIIRRRVVVSHRSDLDSSPSVCEMIDIENCCNMNVCETPCYERLGSFSGGTTTTSSSTSINGGGGCGTSIIGGRTRKVSVKEDKKCLLTA